MHGVGIDPGVHGGIADVVELAPGRFAVAVFRMPTQQVVVSGSKRDRIDEDALSDLLDAIVAGEPDLVMQERVWARPIRRGLKVITPAADTMLQLGMAAGIARGMVRAKKLPFETVSPAEWKKALGVPADKDAAREAASRLLPGHGHLWKLKKDDGLAEAALMALFAIRRLRGTL